MIAVGASRTEKAVETLRRAIARARLLRHDGADLRRVGESGASVAACGAGSTFGAGQAGFCKAMGEGKSDR